MVTSKNCFGKENLSYSYVRRDAYFWTSSEFSTTYTESAYTRSPTSVSWGGYPKYLAQSVRCVKD